MVAKVQVDDEFVQFLRMNDNTSVVAFSNEEMVRILNAAIEYEIPVPGSADLLRRLYLVRSMHETETKYKK